MTKSIISQEQLKQLLNYCPETGIFTWLVQRQCIKAGSVAGFYHSTTLAKHSGYRKVIVCGKQYFEHRLAFLYMTGSIPKEVDHINRIRDDNRWANLRPTNRSINMLNASTYNSNTSGCKGVSCRKDGKFTANITVNKKRIYLGIYEQIWDAICARKSAENKYL